MVIFGRSDIYLIKCLLKQQIYYGNSRIKLFNLTTMSTSALFQKHFGNTHAVGLNHPNMVSFFDELAEECGQEDEMIPEEHRCNCGEYIDKDCTKCEDCIALEDFSIKDYYAMKADRMESYNS